MTTVPPAMPAGLALLVIDMQNSFLATDGVYVRSAQPLPGASDVVERTAALVSSSRQAGVPVIYTRHCFRPDLLDMPPSARRKFPPGTRPMVAGSWDADIVHDLAPTDRDIVIDKNRFDAFLYTDLEVVLRALRVGGLVVAGIVTHACVETTVRSAQQRDFEVVVATDCTTSPTVELRDASLRAIQYSFGTVCDSADALAVATDALATLGDRAS